jgi:hypothetical protein
MLRAVSRVVAHIILGWRRDLRGRCYSRRHRHQRRWWTRRRRRHIRRRVIRDRPTTTSWARWASGHLFITAAGIVCRCGVVTDSIVIPRTHRMRHRQCKRLSGQRAGRSDCDSGGSREGFDPHFELNLSVVEVVIAGQCWLRCSRECLCHVLAVRADEPILLITSDKICGVTVVGVDCGLRLRAIAFAYFLPAGQGTSRRHLPRGTDNRMCRRRSNERCCSATHRRDDYFEHNSLLIGSRRL